jgi:hypothetical protein
VKTRYQSVSGRPRTAARASDTPLRHRGRGSTENHAPSFRTVPECRDSDSGGREVETVISAYQIGQKVGRSVESVRGLSFLASGSVGRRMLIKKTAINTIVPTQNFSAALRAAHDPKSGVRGRDFSSEDSNPDSESGFQIRKTRPCALGTLFTRKATPLHTLGVS